MIDKHYEDPSLAVLYDVECGWSPDREFYLQLAGLKPIRILDLGCGTGLIAAAYADRDHFVTGVDPARAMLDVARARPGGSSVQWVEATAQTFRQGGLFDLIIMTGHAFQVLLGDVDVYATLETMRRHLAPGGRAVFETRNPAIAWETRWHGGHHSFTVGGHIFTVSTRVLSRTANRIVFERHYQLGVRQMASRSELAFRTREELAEMLEHAGLALHDLWGDWAHGPFDPVFSEELVFSVGLANADG